ncbi:IS5 family transposase (plasmid) [Acidithiobacillus caldus]|uniref:IS5 family transposase n=1 Tax=Acidithiobacillus caldus TaxID=33059 RepID=UPI00122C3EAE|nr:IS5 family transposase [Acidithiobacillus caldus]QEM40783.1 IS5 family transposase [Acidithiobacillus caldus]
MVPEELFSLALGLVPPWLVDHVTFTVEEKRLDLHINFPKGSRFACSVCGEECPVHDTRDHTWRHMAQAIFAEVQSVLQEKGLLLQEGKTVDATLIHAPSSTKNRDRKRDPEMSSTKKGNQWYFGMKAHVATDLQGIVQTVDFTAAKVPDHQMLDGLLTGEESVVLGDRGYDYPQVHDTLAARGIRNAVARRRYPGQKTGLAALKRYNRAIARIRARGEHIFRVLKCQFGYRRTRYRGLGKNGAQLTTLFALANLYMLRRYLLAA